MARKLIVVATLGYGAQCGQSRRGTLSLVIFTFGKYLNLELWSQLSKLYRSRN